jgi:CheY-like chemotaxis protein
MSAAPRPRVLIVEDGDEYLHTLTRFVPGPVYAQVKSGAAALDALRAGGVDLVYLDMRFDRVPLGDLLGDHEDATRRHNGDPAKGWRHLQNHQGLFILDHLVAQDFGGVPVILAYDFSRELRRLEFLRQRVPKLYWVGDAVTPEEVLAVMNEALSG